jgi:hypothetical protein
MRTTITLSNSLLKELQHYAHTKKITRAITIAVEDWIRMRKIAEIKKLRGKLQITDNLSQLRRMN